MRANLPFDSYPRASFQQKAVGLHFGKQRIVYFGNGHFIRGTVEPQSRITEQNIIEFVHQHIVGVAGHTVLSQTQNIAQPHDLPVVIAIKQMCDNRFIDVAVCMNIYHAGSRNKSDTAALRIQKQLFPTRIGAVVETTEIASRRNP